MNIDSHALSLFSVPERPRSVVNLADDVLSIASSLSRAEAVAALRKCDSEKESCGRSLGVDVVLAMKRAC